MSKVRFVDNVGVSAFGNLDGKNALVTASADGNNIIFTKGDRSKFTISVTGGGGGTTNTGSLLTTGSVNLNTLTFTKGDGTFFTLTVDTGSGGGSVPTGTVSSSAQITEFGFVSQSGGIVDLPNVKIQYANVYNNLVDLPAAANYHGMFAHVHATGKGYYAHGGAWIELANASSVNALTSSIDNSLQTASVSNNVITFSKNDGSSFAVTVNTGSGTSIDTGSFVQNSQTSSMTVGTASIANFIPFNGNRSVSNQDQPEGIKNVNFNANGLADFIEKVYFTNTAPTILTSNFTIGEFVVSGSLVGFVTASDAESGSQTIIFSTSSTYTADQFRIHSGSGKVTLNVKSTSSMNTFGSGSSAVDVAPFPVIATDTFGLTGSKTIFIRVTPNTAPIWSDIEGGSSTPNITSSLAEASSLGNDKDRYFFRDEESDTITIGSGSFSTHFTTAFRLVKESNYVRLDQITSSLDYDLYPTYSFVLTASDEHYESGDDPNSIAYLPVRINVTDDIPPSINPQDLTGINENSSTGAVAGTVDATNSDGGTLTFSGFALKAANKDGGTNITNSLGGTSLLDPSEDPFQINSGTGQVTRKAGQFLNSDIANRYIYTTTVTDNLNPSSNSADVTIEIANDPASTVEDNWDNLYIIESARTGEFIKNAANGFEGSTAQWSSAASQRWDLTSNPDFIEVTNLTASATQLRLSTNLSGSATVGGDTINLALTASENAFFTTKQLIDQNVSVVTMSAPDFTTSDQSSNLNTNGARPGNALVTASITDPQSYGLNHSTFTFTPNAGQNLVAVRDGSSDRYFISASANLAAGTYGYTASIFNDRGFRTGSLQDEFTIAQAGSGTLTTNGTFYIIESALNGANIVTNPNGRTGTQGDLGVNYSPRYNLASVQGFTSSNATIAVASNGNLTVAANISGSGVSGGDTITSNITWNDQYGNAGGPTAITINVANNSVPTGSFSNVSPLVAPLLANTKLVDVSITDPENDTPFSMSLGGASASSLKAIPTNAVSSSYEIRTTGSVSGGITFTYNATIRDNFGKTRTYTGNTVTVDPIPLLWYAYAPEVGAYATDVAGAFDSYGDTLDNGTLDTNYPLYNMANGDLGDLTITSSALVTPVDTNAEFSFLVASGSSITASRTTLFLEGLNLTIGQQGATGLIIIFPSGSSNFLQPKSMGNSYGDNTDGRYLMSGDTPGVGSDGPRASGVRYYDFVGSNTYPNGTETRFGAIVLPSAPSTNINYYLMSASGSAPASQQ
tara:strand:+ start:671 stop:4423 length:3753 start_codon:yes stop_codon:yes gene_type:complete